MTPTAATPPTTAVASCNTPIAVRNSAGMIPNV